MPKTLYALLVGINDYPAPVSKLSGCVNDIKLINDFLTYYTKGQQYDYKSLMLLDDKATREGVINGFKTFLCQATSNDAVLFYYSGHGSQQDTPPEFWHIEPDRLNETIVCYDSRTPGEWDLADKEISKLIHEVAANDPHITIILDCCHSGGGTRETNTSVRQAPKDDRVRPASTFISSVEDLTSIASTLSGIREDKPQDFNFLRAGRHVALSACMSNELAKELSLGGERRGIFSYYLLDTLQSAQATLSYRNLYKRISALVRANVALQTPQIDAINLADVEQGFLGGAVAGARSNFVMSYSKDKWIIDGGKIHGVDQGEADEKTVLAIFPFDAPDVKDPASLLGQATVQRVLMDHSEVEPVLADGSRLNTQTTYQVLVVSVPMVPCLVHLDGREDEFQLVRKALSVAGHGKKPSLLVREGDAERSVLKVNVTASGYVISRAKENYPLVAEIPNATTDAANVVVQQLEHIARWLQLMQLTNKQSNIPAGAIQIDIQTVDENGKEIRNAADTNYGFTYYYEDGEWHQPLVKIKLKNTSSSRLYVALFSMPESYGIFPVIDGGGTWLEGGEETYVKYDGSTSLPLYIPDRLWERNLTELKETLKLVVSTAGFDASLLQQEDLEVSVVQRGFRATVANSLERLLARVGTRHFGPSGGKKEPVADWNTSEITITIIRPKEVKVNPGGRAVHLTSDLVLESHASFQATVGLTPITSANRDTGISIPSVFRNNNFTETLEFGSVNERGMSGLSVLELTNMQNMESITEDAPLVLRTSTKLQPDEMILPVAFDGEFYLPVGYSSADDSGSTIRIVRVPEAVVSTRSLKGALKIFFQKLSAKYLGLEYEYPILRKATPGVKNGKIGSDDSKNLPGEVKNAQRILLCVHGIIGDTQGIVDSLRPDLFQPAIDVPALAKNYDLVLAFDYENLNTKIEENAVLLREKLAEIGLKAGHGKTLDIIAHSMGGLVSRWFVEKEHGDKIVSKLIMLGTPNAGSPWPKVEQWATVTLGFALNGLTSVSWPVSAISTLVAAIHKKATASLEQMQPGSPFLKSLSGSSDPGVPYIVVSGQTSMIIGSADQNGKNILERFLSKIKFNNISYRLADIVFKGEANDMAVSLKSIQHIPADRKPAPQFLQPIACSHVTYFTNKEVLTVLGEVLS